MTYKFLNTFIDDLFAFTIKMPTLHRLATLRDDVIFFVYLYQSWAYKVDYSRVNEFGQGGADEDQGAVDVKKGGEGDVKKARGGEGGRGEGDSGLGEKGADNVSAGKAMATAPTTATTAAAGTKKRRGKM